MPHNSFPFLSAFDSLHKSFLRNPNVLCVNHWARTRGVFIKIKLMSEMEERGQRGRGTSLNFSITFT